MSRKAYGIFMTVATTLFVIGTIAIVIGVIIG